MAKKFRTMKIKATHAERKRFADKTLKTIQTPRKLYTNPQFSKLQKLIRGDND